MRVLIIGARGQVGHELVRQAPPAFELIALGSHELDISSAAQVNQAVAEYQPALIINAAAYTAVDQAETDTERAYAVNRDACLHLAHAAQQTNIPLLHISTDYVFSGQAAQPYCESVLCQPQSIYGASKLAGEQAIAQHCPQHIILRTSWVFGIDGNNFVKTMLRLAQTRTELSVVDDQHGNPTSARSIAMALWRIVNLYQTNPSQPWGTYHYSGTPSCTWYEFATEIFAQALQLGLIAAQPSLNPITTADYPTAAKRPAYSVLDNQLFSEKFGINPLDWRQELSAVLLSLRAHSQA